MKQEEYFGVGVITGTHGLRGEVKVFAQTDFPKERFKHGAKLYVRRPGETPFQELEVNTARVHKKFWLVSFTGFPSISDVESLCKMELCVHVSQLKRLPKGTFYVHDMIGLRVETEDGVYVGQLVEVLTPGANDVYVVKGPLQKADVLVPAIHECILDVDLQRQVMTVKLLPGLVEGDEKVGSEPQS